MDIPNLFQHAQWTFVEKYATNSVYSFASCFMNAYEASTTTIAPHMLAVSIFVALDPDV